MSVALFLVIVHSMKEDYVLDGPDWILLEDLMRCPVARGRVNLDSLSPGQYDRLRDFVETWVYEQKIAGMGGTSAATRWLRS